MKLKPILNDGEQIFNYLEQYMNALKEEPWLVLEGKMRTNVQPQVIILPVDRAQTLMKFLEEKDKLGTVMSSMGPLNVLTEIFGCAIYASNLTDEIEIF